MVYSDVGPVFLPTEGWLLLFFIPPDPGSLFLFLPAWSVRSGIFFGMEIDRRTILKWGVTGAGAALLGLPLLKSPAEEVRYLIVYRWGAWPRGPYTINGSRGSQYLGWIQCRFQDLQALDIAVVFDCDYHSDEEFTPDGRLLRGLEVKSDARKTMIEGKAIWMVEADGEVPAEEVRRNWRDVDKIVFAGDGKGGYLGCAGTKGLTWANDIPDRMLRRTPPVTQPIFRPVPERL